MLFSATTQTFYDNDLYYPDLPDDVQLITKAQHAVLYPMKNEGRIIFPDFTWSTPKPSKFHEWNGTEWIDPRTPEEIAAYNRALLPKLSKRQFALYLYDNEMYDDVMQTINANPRFKIEYDSVSDIERLSPTVSDMSQLLGWTDEQIDQMWQEALLL